MKYVKQLLTLLSLCECFLSVCLWCVSDLSSTSKWHNWQFESSNFTAADALSQAALFQHTES